MTWWWGPACVVFLSTICCVYALFLFGHYIVCTSVDSGISSLKVYRFLKFTTKIIKINVSSLFRKFCKMDALSLTFYCRFRTFVFKWAIWSALVGIIKSRAELYHSLCGVLCWVNASTTLHSQETNNNTNGVTK